MIDLSDHARIRIGRAMASATIGLAVISIVGAATIISPFDLYDSWTLHNTVVPAMSALLGWILVGAQPRNRLVWLLIWISLGNTVASAVGLASLNRFEGLDVVDLDGSLGPQDLTMIEAVAVNLGWWGWIPVAASLGTLGLLWFPDGRVPAKPWRAVEAMSFISILALAAGMAWQTRPFGDYAYPTAQFADAHPLLRSALTLAFVTLIASVLLSIVSLVVRYRSSRGMARRRLRWIVWGGGAMAGLGASAFVLDLGTDGTNPLFKVASLIGLACLFAGYGLAIRREQLFDIDVVLSRTLLIGFLTLFITVCYVAIVFGVGALVGRTGGDQALSLLATVAVAFLFQPVRRWLEHLANRLVYGRRATPYEVLSDLTGRLTNAEAVGGLLDRLVERLADGTAAESAVLWRATESGFEPSATWPSGQAVDPIIHLPVDSVPIQRAGTVLGALSVSKRRGDEMTPTERRLMVELAGSAALVLDKVRLDSALEQQARRLFESRRRQLDAQGEERQRLERHLNETTRRQLTELEHGIDRAAVDASEDGADTVAEQLAALGDHARAAADEVRALAQGIFPPLLETDGLVSAVRNLADGLPLPIEVDGHHEASSSDLDTETAVYFCIAEALTNVVKHADATHAIVRITEEQDSLTFVVADDGHGFDANAGPGLSTGLTGLTDRLEAVGGLLTIESEPGRGTIISGTVAPTVVGAPLPAGSMGG